MQKRGLAVVYTVCLLKSRPVCCQLRTFIEAHCAIYAYSS